MKTLLWRLITFAAVLGVVAFVLVACSQVISGSDATELTENQTHQTTLTTEESTGATEPPVTEPPETEPPETEPPETEPPETEPPETEPPETEPPETEPPETEPPAPQNDIGKQLTADEFTIKVLAVQRDGDRYTVIFTLTYAGEGSHALNAKERIFVVNSDRRSLAVDNVYDTEGNSLLGSAVQGGQTITIKAVFVLANGSEPTAFRYVYDTMGFRRIQAQL